MRRLLAGCTAASLILGVASTAEAFTTRTHILLANELRKALSASGGQSVPLRFGPHAVELSAEDAQAILDHPLELRAGAVGPDNIAFPGLTDPSHAVGQRPFEQCELLYQEAVLPEERAYAIGCFLHGATDAVSHHSVNYLAGETFTLTPISSARSFSWANVVRHVTSESMIQQAAHAQAPEAFGASELAHSIPTGFVLRAYFDTESPLWQLMAARAQASFLAAKAQSPGSTLLGWISQADLAPADHLVLSPLYLAEVDAARVALKQTIELTIADLQSPLSAQGQQLGVSAGSDGLLGTTDDDTDCSASCPTLYAKYKVYVALLAPRYDAAYNPLPSAFDKLSDELRGDLFQFLPAYVASIQNVSAKLNEPLVPGQSQLGLTQADVPLMFAPMKAWASDLTTLDYLTLTKAILPDWLQQLESALQTVGVNVDVPAILEALLAPLVDPIKEAIESAVIAQAEALIADFIDEYVQQEAATLAEYTARLGSSAPPGLGGTALDHFFDSGLYGHAFNAAAAAVASHAAVLPVGQAPADAGPATFDASHTLAWMQLGACEHLRQAVFPLGIDVRGALSVRAGDGQDFWANVEDDSPIECHDGTLTAFSAAPTVPSCELVSVSALVADPAHRGTVSRAHPPELSATGVTCTGLEIPGLPGPSSGGSGGAGGSGSGGGGAGSGGVFGQINPDSGSDDGGCACRAGSRERRPNAPVSWLALALTALAWRRARRRLPAVALLSLASCSAEGGAGGAGGAAAAAGTGGLGAGGGGGAGGAAGTGGGGTSATGGAAGAGGSGATGGLGGSGGSGGGAAQALLDALGTSIWQGLQTRSGKQRAYELAFDAGSSLWAETRNPYGPARHRQMRAMQVEPDGKTVHTTVVTPAGWPIGPDNGEKADWTLEIVPGLPRKLRVTRAGSLEEFTEGPWPAPTSGLTAIVRVFAPGGAAAAAFCEKNTFSTPDRSVIWDFARGKSAEQPTEMDIVAGVPLGTWSDPTQNNQFAVTNVPGFDSLGGTELSDQFHFIVLYRGIITHPGGSIALREYDDDVKDAVWAFLGNGVGSANPANLFLEVHGHATSDLTADAPSAIYPAQDLPFEAMLLRCDQALQDIDLEAELGSGWLGVGSQPTKPLIDATLFPPAL